jgi:hypothetical protein
VALRHQLQAGMASALGDCEIVTENMTLVSSLVSAHPGCRLCLREDSTLKRRKCLIFVRGHIKTSHLIKKTVKRVYKNYDGVKDLRPNFYSFTLLM